MKLPSRRTFLADTITAASAFCIGCEAKHTSYHDIPDDAVILDVTSKDGEPVYIQATPNTVELSIGEDRSQFMHCLFDDRTYYPDTDIIPSVSVLSLLENISLDADGALTVPSNLYKSLSLPLDSQQKIITTLEDARCNNAPCITIANVCCNFRASIVTCTTEQSCSLTFSVCHVDSHQKSS